MSDIRLEVKNVSKSFGITKALDEVSFNINKGESDSTKIILLIQYYKFSLKKASNNIENSDNIEIQYFNSLITSGGKFVISPII